MNAVKSNEIVLLLFDISNFDSFQWIVDRAHLIHQLKKIPPSVILIGTKYDLDWKRDVEAEDAYQLAEHFKWQYVEISAADQSIADHVSNILTRSSPHGNIKFEPKNGIDDVFRIWWSWCNRLCLNI